MPVKNSYKTTIERSTMRDSGYLHTTSCGKLLDDFDFAKKFFTFGKIWILSRCTWQKVWFRAYF